MSSQLSLATYPPPTCRNTQLDIVYLCQVDQNELTRLILKLKDIKSPGWDNIGNKLIKDNIPVIINPLTHILNLSISSGIVPEKLKLAKVIPVYKNMGETCIQGNYRPISLLSVFHKLLEKVMYTRLYSYLQAHNNYIVQLSICFSLKLHYIYGSNRRYRKYLSKSK